MARTRAVTEQASEPNVVVKLGNVSPGQFVRRESTARIYYVMPSEPACKNTTNLVHVYVPERGELWVVDRETRVRVIGRSEALTECGRNALTL